MRTGEGECARERDATRGEAVAAPVIPANRAISAQPRVYPLLMIAGVYRMSFANLQEGWGLAVYALPACALLPSNGITRHRARVKARDAQRAFRNTFIDCNTDITPPASAARFFPVRRQIVNQHDSTT